MRVRAGEGHLPRLLLSRRRALLLYVCTDAVLVWGVLCVAGLFVPPRLEAWEFWHLQRDRLLIVLLFLACGGLLDLMTAERACERFESAYYGCVALGLAAGLALAPVTFVPPGFFTITPREVVFGALLGCAVIGPWHYGAAHVLRGMPSFQRRFFVLGPEAERRRIAEAIRSDRQRRCETWDAPLPALDSETEGLLAAASGGEMSADAILIVKGGERMTLAELKAYCERRFDRTFLYPGVYEVLMFEHRRLVSVAGIPLVQLAGPGAENPYFPFKRAMDILGALLGLAVLGPVCLAAALAVRWTTPGPVFYRQERLGRYGQPFRILKIRTMYTDREARDAVGRPVPASADDPRVTPVGRFLRKHRIDEIPQLWNVLRGDMSLVGPRPLWRGFFDAVPPEERLLVEHRLLVRPGLTSLSHILGYYDSQHGDRLRYDALYINTLSFANDLKVLLATVAVVLSGKGAQ
jgi:lipopolysaccharide/colanic/teichoic acid biosynthesis glycosyltransferase